MNDIDYDQKNYQFCMRIEELQEDQLNVKKEQRQVEEQQEAFFYLQQKEQQAYEFVLNSCETEERAFYQDRGDESLHLAKKAQRELEEQQIELQKEYRSLLAQEESVNAEQTSFWKQKEGESSGT
ncbi:DUF3958 family protein [Enterococcus plantarum]|uniref:DUF3958 family protein n=1 Tax=Enterococcus plantarum TaxID=1077675 RepID=UPI001A8FB3DA|nr:DUF3958 family protein [Enterococcus plantarum]MBO0422573.1 DUF3958 family protein [Enterococcus plantarum]